MIMEIKMNNSLTFDEVADKLGCSVEDLQKIALENGLIDENGNPTEMAIREGLFSQYATMEDEYGTVNITVSHSEYDMIAVCISDPEDHERDSVAFISREKAHALGEYLLNQVFPTLSYEVGRLFTSVNVAIRNIIRKDYENNR